MEVLLFMNNNIQGETKCVLLVQRKRRRQPAGGNIANMGHKRSSEAFYKWNAEKIA